MTSKERVLKTIAHQEPDRVPTGEWGVDHDHVSKIIGHHTYWRNRKDTTIALWDNRRDEVVESLKEDCVQLVDALDYDIITLELVPSKNARCTDRPREIGEGVWENKAGQIFKYAASNDSIACVTHPEGRFAVPQEEIDRLFEEAGAFDDSQFELIDYIADHYGDEKALLIRDLDIFNPLMAPFGGDFNHQMMLTALCPEEIMKFQDICFKRNQAILEHCSKKGFTLAMQGFDFGMNTGCIMSPASIRELYMPVMKRINEETVRLGMIPFYHCCGNIWDIMEDYIAAGYRGYQSIQESAGMDTRRVKELYGDRLTLWTGVQCETMILGSLQDAENEIRRNLEFLMPGGGYIFGSTNSVQFGAKTENYLRALDIVHKEGIYR